MDWSENKEKSLFLIKDGGILRELLQSTKGRSSFQFSELPSNVHGSKAMITLQGMGLFEQESEHMWRFPGFIKVQVAIRALELGEGDRIILETLTWQEFEEYVANIFLLHNFLVTHRFRFSTSRRYEIDIVASKKPFIFCVDCKQFGIRLGKASVLRKASEEQLNRTEALARNFSAHQVKLNCLDWTNASFIPVLVTMLYENIVFHDKIPIVPAARLNAFILNYHEQLDRLSIIKAEMSRQQRLC